MIRNKNGYINDTAYPLYYFGHGLSYTQFRYSGLKTEKDRLSAEDELKATVQIENTGSCDGAEVVQFYIADKTASMVRPELELVGFQRVFLKRGEKKSVSLKMKLSQCAFLDKNMKWIVEAGEMELLCGSSCVDIRCGQSFEIADTTEVDEKTRGFYAECRVED